MKIIRGDQIPFVAASHEDPAQPGVLKRVLATREDVLPGRVQMINWAKLPRGSEFKAHYHQDMQETFVILNESVEMTVEGDTCVLANGDAILIEPNQVHKMKNVSERDVNYVVIGVSLDQGGQTVVVE